MLDICDVFLVLKKVDINVIWFYFFMGDDDLMMKSKFFNVIKFFYRIFCVNVKYLNRKYFLVYYKVG